MKRILLTCLLVIAAHTTVAQGRVALANDSTRLVFLYSSIMDYPVVSQALAASLGNLVVDLYVGKTAANLIYSGLTATTWSDSSPGQWNPVYGYLPTGFPGGSTQKYFFQIQVRPSAYASASLAQAAGEIVGVSDIFQAHASTSAISAYNLTITASPVLSTWTLGKRMVTGAAPGSLGAIPVGIIPIPEPSNVTLFGFSSATLLLISGRNRLSRN